MQESGSGSEPLQFDVAEHADAAAPSTSICAGCRNAVTDSYYELNGKVVCATCCGQGRASLARGSGGFGVFAKAAALGLAAAVVGCLGWYAIRRETGMELGIVAIGVGILVGIAVRKGSGRRGGWVYQALAMFLTYNAAALNYAPEVLDGFRQAALKRHASSAAPSVTPPSAAAPSAAAPPAAAPSAAAPSVAPSAEPPSAAPAIAPAPTTDEEAAPAHEKTAPKLGAILLAAILFYGFLLAVPFLAGFQNILGIIIIGIGVYEAWKINRRPRLALNGPYRMAATAPTAPKDV